jgi:uncharacterized membrane protein YgcG
MRVDALRFKAAAGAALCCAALTLAALAGGCARGTQAPAGGEASTPSQALAAGSTPAQNTRPAPSPTVESPLPPPEGFVNDFANVLDAETERLLEEKFERLKARARIEFAVVTVETTGGQDILDYSLAVARGWSIGPPAGEEGGGLLLLLATKDRQWRLQVSRSLEADLPDEAADKIGRSMRPSLSAERYGEAVNKCADDLIKHLADRRGFSTGDAEPAKSVNRKP